MLIPDKKNNNNTALNSAMRAVHGAMWGAAGCSLVVNLLMLTGPLFMLQIYDRVLTSGSVPTLVALMGLTVGLFAFLGVFDFLRSRILSRIGYWLDHRLSGLLLHNWISQSLSRTSPQTRPLNDLSALRSFFGSQGLPALFDLPWTPLYLAIIFLLHFYLGLLALTGAIIVVIVALINEFLTRKPLQEAFSSEALDNQLAAQSHRNGDVAVAMGMTQHLVQHWQQLHMQYLQRAQSGGEIGEGFAAFSKAFRLLLQSAMLGLGAYLAIYQLISPGTIIAASILAGRALAPLDQTIGNWRNILRARQAYSQLSQFLANLANNVQSGPLTELPKPQGHLSVQSLTALAPQASATAKASKPILQGIHFSLSPGDALAVIGPSASGKSTLARYLVGLSLPERGSVRLDGATYDQWNADQLGQHIGYLPQAVEMFTGTVAQNISRFEARANDEQIIAAAKLAGVHDLILALPDGYATKIGFNMAPLSGGQVQRISLARAVYRLPSLIVLDEPNSNLDLQGDEALTRTIAALRKADKTVVVMTHRRSAIAAVNLILMLQEGRQIEFGPKADVLRKVTQPPGTSTGTHASTTKTPSKTLDTPTTIATASYTYRT